MQILTLTSDWGLRDHYLASFKGLLLSRIPGLQLIDISHDVEDHNTIEAAYLVRNTYDKFPAGTIHFIAVSNTENIVVENPYVLIKHKGHVFIGEDNGIFSLIIGKDDRKIIRLPIKISTGRKELHHRFIELISKICEGEFESLGTEEDTIVESFIPQPSTDMNSIRGSIVYTDSSGNAILNVSKELFERERKERKFSIQFRKSQYEVNEISQNYGEVENGEIVALFNQDDFLEIAINRGDGVSLLGLRVMDPVRIEFHDSPLS